MIIGVMSLALCPRVVSQASQQWGGGGGGGLIALYSDSKTGIKGRWHNELQVISICTMYEENMNGAVVGG